ncbi:hypothetical protein A3C87_03730 [Candidatus Kaiserbacteria bacterium RIFCSPHIGHO2_02_FULL_49_34]|uniref:Uncharacterized protein n=1 Tax=Candidatus Kaiserbacteria bacterium RIFCSPHIGHO2_02_FULL_49_34 TaxID=1798491 RepID=A0A1F6DIP6_9BACT|nr:MAG: hypothetical protein A3C87_03730 [Candidatus Kaiserbacteria bacterium RIFCSPHIGHO2_02_FULL_49_34]
MATKKVAAKGLSGGEKVGLGVALTAAAVGAIGAYFLAGSKDAAKNRKMVKSWMLKAKAEVLEGLEQAKKMSAEEYAQLIDKATAVYASTQKASKKDIEEFKDEMSQHWKKLERTGKKVVKKVTDTK